MAGELCAKALRRSVESGPWHHRTPPGTTPRRTAAGFPCVWPSDTLARSGVPVYVYRRQDGSTFEIEQRITEDALVECPTTGQEVARVLSAAEDSAARIVEQARITAAHNTAVSQRQWREVQRSLARFAGWRDRVEPQMVEIHARLEELRSRIGEIPERVRAAFAPLADASAATEAGLQALFDDFTDPLVRAPSPARDDAEFPGAANGPGGSHSELAEGPRAAGSIP